MTVVVYSKQHCPFCDKAKHLLTTKGVEFQEVKIDEDVDAREFIMTEGHRTVPQIYQDGKLLVEGGYTGLSRQSAEFFNQLKG